MGLKHIAAVAGLVITLALPWALQAAGVDF